MSTENAQVCPCGSSKRYIDCCEPLHKGHPAATPEQLMRSRYSAFVQGRVDYLKDTWHTSTRPPQLDLSDSPDWRSLQVFSSTERGSRGTVHFRASYPLGNDWHYLEEVSEFVREEGRWYYLEGETRQGRHKLGRNDACPCGSGLKVKKCCG